MATTDRMGGRWGRRLGWLWVCYSLVAVAAEVESQNPQDWLRAMVDAMQRLDYQATVVYSRDNRMQMLRLAHQVRDGVIHEHLQSLADPMREVVREADKVTCYFPERRTLVEYRNRSGLLFSTIPAQWGPQESYYRLEMGRRGHMVGRPAQEIIIRPLDGYRYSRRIWIDTATYLPVKFELLSKQGDVLEAFAVTDLKVGEALSVKPLHAAAHHDGWRVLDRKEEASDARWKLSRLPDGFREVRRSKRLDPVDSDALDHVLISDGMATVSVYIQEGRTDGFDPGNLRLGAVSVFSRKINDSLVTVVGDVPLVTVRMIGEGVQEAQ